MNQDEERKQQTIANQVGESLAELEGETKRLEDENRKLRIELQTLRFKEAQEQSGESIENTNPDYDNPVYHKQELARRDEIINRLQTECRWIPVDEKLPEMHESVIIYCKDGYITTSQRAMYGERVRNNFPFNDVTHWMPLPKPPEEMKRLEEER